MTDFVSGCLSVVTVLNWTALVAGNSLQRWTPAGYDGPHSQPRTGVATVITPPSLVEVLRRGWDPAVPLLHPSSG